MASQTEEDVYIEYLNYDWESFTEFQDGLKEILDNFLEGLKEQDNSVASIPSPQRQQLINQAKCYFYCTHTGNILNLNDFEDWKRQNGDKYLKNKKIEEIYDDQEEPAQVQTEQKTSGNEPPYSSNYKELVNLILKGKPVPGIKQVPDTVLSDKVSEPRAAKRVKPWEKATQEHKEEEESYN